MYLLVKIRSYVNELPKCRALIFASPARRHRGMRARNAMEIWKMMVTRRGARHATRRAARHGALGVVGPWPEAGQCLGSGAGGGSSASNDKNTLKGEEDLD